MDATHTPRWPRALRMLAATAAALLMAVGMTAAPASAATAGDSWTSAVSGTSQTLWSVAYGTPSGSGRWVAVGDFGTILTSPDGVTWTSRSSGTSADLRGVTYGGSQFVAVGTTGTVLTSADGITWDSRTSGTSNNLLAVTYGTTGYVAVGTQRTIRTSADGTAWSAAVTGFPSGTEFTGVAFGNGVYVASGYNSGPSGLLYSSTDGSTWTYRSGAGVQLNAVTYGAFGFVAVGNDPNNDPFVGPVLRSSDGVTWSIGTNSLTNYQYAVAAGAGRYVAGSIVSFFSSPRETSSIYVNSSGSTWSLPTSGQVFSPQAIYGLGYGAGTFVGVGPSGGIIYSASDLPGPLTFDSGAFPAATVGSAVSLTVTVTNTGTAAATPSDIAAAGTGVSVTGGPCAVGTPIGVSGTCTVILSWTPSAVGALTGGSLTISYPDGAAASNSVTLTGTATASGGGGGGSTGGSTSEPSPTPSPTASAPLPSLGAESVPGGLMPGGERATVGGSVVPVVVTPNAANTGLDVSSAGWRLSLAARSSSGAPVPLGPNGVLRFVQGQGLFAEGVGFRPNSPVMLYLFSDAVLLGELTTDASGSFSGTVPLPADVPVGAHIAQVNGYTTGGEVRSVSLGVEVIAAASTSTSVGSRVYFPYESAKLTAKAKRTLRSLVAQVPGQASASSVVVGVVRAKGQKPSDRVLARARAANVSRYLKAAGLPGTVTVTTRSVAVKTVAEARRVLVTVRYTS